VGHFQAGDVAEAVLAQVRRAVLLVLGEGLAGQRFEAADVVGGEPPPAKSGEDRVDRLVMLLEPHVLVHDRARLELRIGEETVHAPVLHAQVATVIEGDDLHASRRVDHESPDRGPPGSAG
jgi:hypothetical protein